VTACSEDHCITCGDDGVPMRVLRVDAGRGLALCVDHDGDKSTVEIGLVEPVAPGDSVLVHAGVALVTLEQAVGA
jgi:hydrogenase assembly chaperone HypC/HupF